MAMSEPSEAVVSPEEDPADPGLHLRDDEIRVLGCLVEKQLTTPSSTR